MMSRPEITRSDMVLRLFLDTNVLIECAEGFDERKCKSFIELLRKNNYDHVELVTSDYVLWEFYGHSKNEFYIRKLVEEQGYGFLSAVGEANRSKSFRKCSLDDMKELGNRVREQVADFGDSPVTIQKLIGQELKGFSDMVEAILRCSKLSYKDTIVFVCAHYTDSNIIVTLDEFFSKTERLQELREAVDELKLVFNTDSPQIDIEFKKPDAFSSDGNVKREFKNWFINRNGDKQIGRVINAWSDQNTIGIDCLDGFEVRTGDYLCLAKFREDIDFEELIFFVGTNSLKDYDTNELINKGRKVTVKLPSDLEVKSHLQSSMVFIYRDVF